MAIKDGKYLAKPILGGTGRSANKNTPGISISFEFDYEGAKKQLVWKGWFTEGASERTFETMALAGLDESKIQGNRIPLEAFDPNAVVEITVENESFTDQKTGEIKSSPKIKWVNKPGGQSFGFAESSQGENVLQGINVKAEMMAARQKLGLKTKPKVQNHAENIGINEKEELPF